MISPRAPQRFILSILLAAMLAFTGYWSWFSIGRAANYNAGWYDLGIMAQTVWRAGHGYGLTFTNPEAGPGGVHGLEAPRTAIHTDYLLFFLAPLSWVGETWQNLLVFQAAMLALGALFLFRIGQRLLGGPWRGLFVAFVYLAYSPLHFALLFEFHAVTLAIPFFFAAADAILAGRRRAMWFWIALALLTKEQVGVSMALFAGFLLFWTGRTRRAGAVIAVCLLWTVLQFAVVIPLSRPGQAASFVSGKFYQSDEGSLAVVKRLFDPADATHRLNTPTHRSNLVQLFAPLGGPIALWSPMTYLLTPELLLYWLSDSPNQQTLFLHYQALFIPFLFLGLILGWRAIANGIANWRPTLARGATMALAILVLVGSGWAAVRFSAFPWSPITRWPLVAWKERQHTNVLEAKKLLPARATVAITQNLGPLVSDRPRVTLLPTGALTERYVFILQRTYPADLTKTNDKRLAEKVMIEQLLEFVAAQPAAYAVRYNQDRVWLIERIGEPTLPEPVWPEPLLGRN